MNKLFFLSPILLILGCAKNPDHSAILGICNEVLLEAEAYADVYEFDKAEQIIYAYQDKLSSKGQKLSKSYKKTRDKVAQFYSRRKEFDAKIASGEYCVFESHLLEIKERDEIIEVRIKDREAEQRVKEETAD